MTDVVTPSEADAGRIAAVINARSLALVGTTEESAEGVAQWFALPNLDPEADMRLAVGADGAPEGYADVSGPEDGSPIAWVDLRVLPGCPEALDLLLSWAKRRADERVGAGGKVGFFVDRRDQAVAARLEGSGYTTVRSSFQMERRLERSRELEPPVWPEGLVPRHCDARDAEAVHAAQDEAFADELHYTPVSHAVWVANSLAPDADSSLWCVAWDADEIAGLCINRPRRGEDETVGWIGDLAVRRPWRRRGLGEALLREAFRVFPTAGKRSAALSVDAENTSGAVALYERVGMRVVRRGDTWERAI